MIPLSLMSRRSETRRAWRPGQGKVSTWAGHHGASQKHSRGVCMEFCNNRAVRATHPGKTSWRRWPLWDGCGEKRKGIPARGNGMLKTSQAFHRSTVLRQCLAVKAHAPEMGRQYGRGPSCPPEQRAQLGSNVQGCLRISAADLGVLLSCSRGQQRALGPGQCADPRGADFR